MLDVSDGDPLASLERFVVDNDELRELEALIGRFNIFDALRVDRAEIRHSNFLGWLLNPSESHGQGSLFLKALLMELLRQSPPELRPFSPVELDGEELRDVEIRREWRRIDILITCKTPEFVIAVENKIESAEHSHQLERYEAVVNEAFDRVPCLFVYLTVDGDEPSRDRWVPFTYEDIHRVLRRVEKTYSNAIGEDVRAFLDHYLRLIGSRFMDDEKIDDLCRRIYRNHRQALELIFERFGPGPGQIVSAINEVIGQDEFWQVVQQSSTRIRFVPSTWPALLPPIGKETIGATKWLNFVFRIGKTACTSFLSVRPTTDDKLRQRVIDLLVDMGFKAFFKNKEYIGGNYTSLGRQTVLSWKEDDEPDFQKLRSAVQSRLQEFKNLIEPFPKRVAAILESGKDEAG